ncbi:MAG: hypothetical protein ICV55_11765 [Coleofasciculus sp. C3-bin4]|jgi:hypothetical protein|nr:hypothetical protein [Coleofasciculus sp. C3-bin4]
MKDSIRSNKLSSGRFFLEASGFKVAVGKSNLLTLKESDACCTLVEFRGAYETVGVKNLSTSIWSQALSGDRHASP